MNSCADSAFARWEKTLLKIGFFSLLIWFLYQTVFLARHVSHGLPPDELHHYYVSLFYKNLPGIFLRGSEATYHYGSLDYSPYLYHLALGNLITLNFTDTGSDIFLRYINVALAAGFLLVFWRFLGELQLPRAAKLLSFVLLTNIPMFVFISSATSYDNLTNLLALLMHVYFIKFLNRNSTQNLLLFLIYLFAGSLSKITFLPFYLIIAVIVLIFRKIVLQRLKELRRERLTLRAKLLLIPASLFFLGNVILYGQNLWRFGAVYPAFETVEGIEIAKKYYPQYQRDINLIATAKDRPDYSFHEFLPKYFAIAAQTALGVMAHKSYSRSKKELRRYAYALIPFGIGFLIFAVTFFKSRPAVDPDTSRALIVLGLSAFMYVAVLVIDNYQSFKLVRHLGYSLQGRYTFPVLANIVLIFSYFSFFKMNRVWIALPILLFISYVFFSLGFLKLFEPMHQAGFF